MNTLIELNKFNEVSFESETHRYLVNGVQYVSATTILSKFHKPFNSDLVAERTAIKRGVSKQSLLNEWKYSADYSKCKGTELHSFAEFKWQCKEYKFGSHSYERMDVVLEDLKKMYNKFYKSAKKFLIPVKSEFIVYDKEYEIAGMIDQIFYNTKDNCLDIWDWKTNKEIKRNNSYNEKLLKPIDHLDACEFYEYALQLSLYRYIIEKNTNLKIGNLYICWFNEKQPDYEIIKVPYLETEIKNLLCWYKLPY